MSPFSSIDYIQDCHSAYLVSVNLWKDVADNLLFTYLLSLGTVGALVSIYGRRILCADSHAFGAADKEDTGQGVA